METKQVELSLINGAIRPNPFITRWKEERRKFDEAHDVWVKTPDFDALAKKLRTECTQKNHYQSIRLTRLRGRLLHIALNKMRNA